MSAWMTEYKRWQKFILHFSLIFRIHCGPNGEMCTVWHSQCVNGKFNSLIYFFARELEWHTTHAHTRGKREKKAKRRNEWFNKKLRFMHPNRKMLYKIADVWLFSQYFVWKFHCEKWSRMKRKPVDLVSVLANGRYEFICLRYAQFNVMFAIFIACSMLSAHSSTYFPIQKSRVAFFPLAEHSLALHSSLKSFEPLSIVVRLKWNSSNAKGATMEHF